MAAASLLSIIRWKRRGLNLSSVCPAAAPATGWTWSCALLPPICAATWIGKSPSRAFNGVTVAPIGKHELAFVIGAPQIVRSTGQRSPGWLRLCSAAAGDYTRSDIDLKRRPLAIVFPDAIAPPPSGWLLLEGTDLMG